MIQERLGRSIMNRLHAMWSLGFLAGAVIGSAMAAAGVGVRPHLVIVGALLLAAVQVARRWLLPIDDPHEPLTTEAGAPARPPRVSPVVVLMAAAALARHGPGDDAQRVGRGDDARRLRLGQARRLRHRHDRRVDARRSPRRRSRARSRRRAAPVAGRGGDDCGRRGDHGVGAGGCGGLRRLADLGPRPLRRVPTVVRLGSAAAGDVGRDRAGIDALRAALRNDGHRRRSGCPRRVAKRADSPSSSSVCWRWLSSCSPSAGCTAWPTAAADGTKPGDFPAIPRHPLVTMG